MTLSIEQQRALAKARARLRVQQSQQEAPEAPDSQQVTPVPASRIAGGAIQAGLTLATGSLAEPIAGLRGIYELAAASVRGDDDPVSAAAEKIEDTRSRLTFQPRTQEGQTALSLAAAPFQKIMEFAQGRADTAFEHGGPVAAAATQTAIEGLPSALGLRSGPAAVARRARDVSRAEREAASIGLDLEADRPTQVRQLQATGEKLKGGQKVRGENIAVVQEGIQQARNAAKAEVDKLYAEARQAKAGVAVEAVRQFATTARQSLDSFDVETMPIVQKRLAELAKADELPDNSVVKLEALSKWRQRLNRNQPATTDQSQRAALGILKGQIDEFLDAQFNADMIKGDPAAVAKWKRARNAHQSYRENFKDNKVIRQLAEQQATPEEVRNWIFGSTQAGFKREAGATIRRIKAILGEDSPAMASLRHEALLDILQPLLKQDPDFRSFAKRYDNLVKDNPTLVRELFPHSANELGKLRKFASAVGNSDPQQIMRASGFDFPRSVAVIMVGDALAKARLRINVAQRIGMMLTSPQGPQGMVGKRMILAEIFGYDPGASLLPPSAVAIGATTTSAARQSEEQPQQ